MPCNISLTSSRISITPLRKVKPIHHRVDALLQKSSKTALEICYNNNFSIKGNPFKLSKSSKRKLFDSINYMYALSPKRNIEMKTGKHIYNYKMSFVTLTLPSKQSHSDKYIKANYLNQFLVELRKHYSCTNFVWKAELQKNDNIHFHLILDKYVDYQALRRRWNRILDKGGYVKAYSNKMNKLTASSYFKMRQDNCIKHNKKYHTDYSITFQDAHKAYSKGIASNWRNPNSVDVKSVFGEKDLAVYLSKYVCKNDDNVIYSDAEIKRQTGFGRSWSRSYSLVDMCYKVGLSYDDIQDVIHYMRNKKNNVKRICGQFFEVFYFNMDSLHKSLSSYLLGWIKLIAVERGYIIPN